MTLSESSLIHSPKSVLAVDPGVSGACFRLGRGVFTGWRDFKYPSEIAHSIRDLCGAPIDFAVIEEVHAMPKQGVCSMFSFGEATGYAKAALVLSLPEGCRMAEVTPQKWQGLFREVYGIRRGRAFNSLEVARKLFPTYAGSYFSRVKDHNSADAALMAVWGMLQIQKT